MLVWLVVVVESRVVVEVVAEAVNEEK